MTRRQRRVHVMMWLVLGPLAAALVVASWLHRADEGVGDAAAVSADAELSP